MAKPFKDGDVVISDRGLIIDVWHDENPDNPNTFTGCARGQDEPFASSALWLIDKCKPYNQNTIKKYKPKYSKDYRVTCAVYKMLKQGKIKKECAIELMHKRGGTKLAIARGCVENWLKHPLKHLNQ